MLNLSTEIKLRAGVVRSSKIWGFTLRRSLYRVEKAVWSFSQLVMLLDVRERKGLTRWTRRMTPRQAQNLR